LQSLKKKYKKLQCVAQPEKNTYSVLHSLKGAINRSIKNFDEVPLLAA
jgi:hypothetical protein